MELPSFEEIFPSLEPIEDFTGIKIIHSSVFDPLIEADRIIVSGVCRLPLDTERSEPNNDALFDSVIITCVREEDSASYSERLIKDPAQEDIDTVDSESNQNESANIKETTEDNFRTGFFSVDLTAHFSGLDLDGKYYVVSSIREHTSNILEVDRLEPVV